MNVRDVTSESMFKDTVKQDSLTVVKFSAAWCGPCKQIKPDFDRIASTYPNVSFLSCDVDDYYNIAMENSIQNLPTFVFYKAGTILGGVLGPNMAAVEKAVKKHG